LLQRVQATGNVLEIGWTRNGEAHSRLCGRDSALSAVDEVSSGKEEGQCDENKKAQDEPNDQPDWTV
jgi:hypothetical protein